MTSSIQQDQWLPLAEAAEKISEVTGKPHTKADVLRECGCGALKLSVQLGTPVFARPGHFQEHAEDAPYGVSTNVQQAIAANGVSQKGGELFKALGIQGVFAYASTGGDYIQGVMDLALIGNCKTHIENMERREAGDSEDAKHLQSGGVYLQGATGLMWEIQHEIISGEPQDQDHGCEYAPAERFPGDWRIVVRTSEVERFCRDEKERIMRAMIRRQSEQKKEHLEIQRILSEHQPTEIDLISPEELQEDYGINIKKALRLGIEGKLRFFAFIKYATIVFGDVIEADEDGKELFDPQYCIDVDKGFYFQVAPATLEEMLQSPEEKNEGEVQLIFPDALKGQAEKWEPDAPGVKYRTQIKSNYNLWSELSERLKVSEGDHLDGQRFRKIKNLCVLKDDVTAYERELANDEQHPTTNQAATVVEQFECLESDNEKNVSTADTKPGSVLRRGVTVYRGEKDITGAYNKAAHAKIKWPGVRARREKGLKITHEKNGKKPLPVLDHVDLLEHLGLLPPDK